MLYGKDFRVQTPSEYAALLEGKPIAVEDERTGAQILEDLIGKLEGGE